MSAQTRPISFPPTSKSRSIRFSSTPTTNRPQPMSTRSITTHPISSAPIIVRRNTTACPAQLDTIDVKPRRLVGRAPPPAQFEIVTPPRSPSRLPQRTKSTNANVSGSPGGTGSTIPRRSPSAFDMAEEQKFYVATMNSAVRRTQRTSQKADRGPPRRPPLRPVFSPRLGPGSAVRAGTGCARADPGLPHYPRLTPDERYVLARKLRVLLKCIDVDSSALDGRDGDALQDAGSNNSGRVFGTSIQDSSTYATCQVVLGDHTHNLPICVFASVEEICRRGITTPALFRFAPSPTERTLESLASAFDQPPYYESRTSLAGEDISNICALLKLYLRALPEPAFSPTLWPILQQITSTSDSSDPEADDATRTAALQALLHLHPPTSFSLLTYLLSFLHHLLTHSSQNNLTIPTLATLFGPALFSPRTQSTTGRGCMSVPSPNSKLKPEGKGPIVLVKSFLSAKEGEEGVRVLSWILERWEGVAVGLLDVDVVRDLDLSSWEAGFLSVHSRKRSSSNATESDSETAYSDNSRTEPSEQNGKEREYKGFPFPESVLLEQVPVREVRDSMVIIEDVHMSTRGSSPTTLWSQETGSNKDPMSRVGSLQAPISPLKANESEVVAELRRRMDAQEAELIALRHELHTIRDRFAFPFPPDQNTLSTPSNQDLDNEDEDEAEDTMPTPRPPSNPHCVDIEPRSDSFDSEPSTPLFQRTIQSTLGEEEDTILHPGVFSDLGPTSPGGSPPPLFVVNPDLIGGQDRVKDEDTDKGQARGGDPEGKGMVDELVTARDALRSALAAMEPVKTQLRFVEKELETRGSA